MFKKNYVIVLSLLSLLSGCSGYYLKDVDVHSPKNARKAIVLVFPKNDLYENPSISDVFNALESNIYSSSKYHKHSRSGDFFMGISIDASGIQVDTSDNRLTITYANGTEFDYKNENTVFYLSTVKFEMPIAVSEKDHETKVTIYYPKKIITQQAVEPGGTTYKYLDNISNLENDIFQLFDKFKEIKLSGYFKLTGSINSSFPSDSIYANFSRLLGEYDWKNKGTDDGIRKINSFNLLYKGSKFPLNVIIYPYRNGSKVVYLANI